MRVELDAAWLWGLLLVLARVAGAFAFLPIPGWRAGTNAARVVLAVALAAAAYGAAPPPRAEWSAPTACAALLGEAILGIGLGVCVSLLAELFALGAQLAALQAGFAYATTIDPSSEVDSGLLVTMLNLASGLLLLALGVDRQLLLLLVRSLSSHPAGEWALAPGMAEGLLRACASLLGIGLRAALPVAGLLLLVDLTLALLGRAVAQVQWGSLAFPLKILATCLILASTLTLLPSLFARAAGEVLRAARILLP